MARFDHDSVGIYYDFVNFTPFYDPSREPIVFLHGLGVDHTVWHGVVPSLARTWPMIFVDLRGHGRSDQDDDGDYSIAAQASDIAALMDHLGLARVNVVGSSMGGLVAQQFAARYPDKLNALVLNGTFCEVPSTTNLDDTLAAFDAAPDIDTYYRPGVSRTLGVYRTTETIEHILGLEGHHRKPVVRKLLQATFGYRDREAARRIKAPTLVTVGEGEVWRGSAEDLLSVIQDSRFVVVEGAAHSPHMEAPEAYGKVLRDHFDRVADPVRA